MPDDAPPPETPNLELPAPPRELRPSPHTLDRAKVEEALEEFTDRAKVSVGALVTSTSAVAQRAGESVGDATDEAIAHVRREGAWRTVFRVVGVVTTLALCLRLAFDDALPRIILNAGAAALGAVVFALGAHAWSLARRRAAMLEALDLLTRVGNAHPDSLAALAPQIASLVEALRAEDPRFFTLRADDPLLRALRTSGNTPAALPRSD